MTRVATFIVDKRNLIFLLVGIAIAFSVFSRSWVTVENDLTAYLPAGSSTKEGLDVMEQQFITYGSAKIMVANVSYGEAEALFYEIEKMPHVIPRGFMTSAPLGHMSSVYLMRPIALS